MPRQAHPWFRRSDGWWYVKINGKPEKLVKGRRKKSAAVDRWHELMLERASNPPPDATEHTVASIIDLYLSHSKRSYAPESYSVRKHYLQAFAEAHGFRLVRDCLPIHLTTWLDAHPKWASDWTLGNVVNIVRRPFNWAVQQGVLALNPFRSVKRRLGEPRRPVTEEEFRALLRATNRKLPEGWKRVRPPKRPSPGARFRQMLLFLRFTGARTGEMTVLTWDDVDLEKGIAVLRKHKTSRTQRVPAPRVIHLVPTVVRLLRYIRKYQKPGAKRIFVTMRGTPWHHKNLALRMRRLRKRAKLPDDVKLYGIRHQFGTQSIVNGVDIKTLAELMGHRSTKMTEHYVHLAGRQEHLAAAMQRAVASHRGT